MGEGCFNIYLISTQLPSHNTLPFSFHHREKKAPTIHCKNKRVIGKTIQEPKLKLKLDKNYPIQTHP